MVTNFFIVLWWLDHSHEPGWAPHLIEAFNLSNEQQVFLEGFPLSAKSLTYEAKESTDMTLKGLRELYKKMFLADAGIIELDRVAFDILLTKTKKNQIERMTNEIKRAEEKILSCF